MWIISRGSLAIGVDNVNLVHNSNPQKCVYIMLTLFPHAKILEKKTTLFCRNKLYSDYLLCEWKENKSSLQWATSTVSTALLSNKGFFHSHHHDDLLCSGSQVPFAVYSCGLTVTRNDTIKQLCGSNELKFIVSGSQHNTPDGCIFIWDVSSALVNCGILPCS